MITYFLSGDLVRSDRPAGRDHVPDNEQKRIGLVLCHVPGKKHGNPFTCAAVAVMWFGPRLGNDFVTIEIDHRLAHV